MALEDCDKLYQYVKEFHNLEPYKDYVDKLDCRCLKPKLRPYQEDAVKWMLYKEKEFDIESLPTEFNGVCVKYPKGGILADEMGLGKTVELLALILNHTLEEETGLGEISLQTDQCVVEESIGETAISELVKIETFNNVFESHGTGSTMESGIISKAEPFESIADPLFETVVSEVVEVKTFENMDEYHSSSLQTPVIPSTKPDLVTDALCETEVSEIVEVETFENIGDNNESLIKTSIVPHESELSKQNIDQCQNDTSKHSHNEVRNSNIKKSCGNVSEKKSKHKKTSSKQSRRRSSINFRFPDYVYSQSDDDSDLQQKKALESDEDYVPTVREKKKRTVKKKKIISSGSEDDEYVPAPKKKKKDVLVANKVQKRKSEQKNSEKYSLSILCHRFSRKNRAPSGTNYSYLKTWYDTVLNSYKSVRDEVEPEEEFQLKCHCSGLYDYDVVQCEKCMSWQHRPCVGLDTFSPKHYYCPLCWNTNKLIKSRCTFIVSPESIVYQWQDELNRHIKKNKLKVICYYGAKGSHYIQPEELADSDVVITTYTVLCRELNYCGNRPERNLRHKKKFHYVTTPLTCIHWWRICLDEVQMVESPTSMAHLMTTQLHSTFKWAVSGTPVQKSLNDLYGLMLFFGMEPFTNRSVWNTLVEDLDILQRYMGHILWRSCKKDVYHMLGIPEQTVKTHWLKFSPVEGYFYQRTHNECASHFRAKLTTFSDLNVPLLDLDRAFVGRLLQPLLQLRQACTHPQVVGGKFLQFKHTMSMEELLTAMVSKVKNDVDVSVRSLVASLNGQAGIKILLGEWHDAVSQYRHVLQLPSLYPKDAIKVDTLQKLHTLHNLADIIKEVPNVAPTLHDDTLGQDALSLEQEYLKKYERLIEKEKEKLGRKKGVVDKLCGERTLGYSDWWEVVITNCNEPCEMVDRIKNSILSTDTKFPIKGSYANRIKNIDSLYGELATWLADADNKRIEIIKTLKVLQKCDIMSLSEQALCCHLRNEKNKSAQKKCRLCQCETVLLAYETLIFEVKKQDKEGRKKNALCESDVECGDRSDNEVAQLQSVTLHKTKKEGNWKPSQMERIVHFLVGYAKQKKFPHEYIEDGSKHTALLEAVRKEFISLRALWKFISDQAAAYDELGMAKLRFRLPFPEEIKDLKARKLKETYIIQEHEILDQLEKLKQDQIISSRDVTKNVGILMYLLNLQKEPNSERDPCPICREPLTDKWSVMQCGHCFCFECIPTLLRNSVSIRMECAICREKTHKDDVAYVDCSKQEVYDEDFQVKGSHSTKVEAIIVETLRIKTNEPNSKILIFSTWEKVLDVVGEAFTTNDIVFKRLHSNKQKAKEILADFKTLESVTALLLPLKLGSKGLNLIEATHVFFIEPVLNPGEELQAVGRIHRIGQTKETYVHRFVIHNTIEERMLTSLDASSEEWSSNKVTVGQLYDLFSLNEPGCSQNPILIE